MKQSLLIFSAVGSVILYLLFNTRDTGLCNIYCGPAIDQFQNIFLFFPIIFIIVLTTSKLDEQVFVYWWKFARWAIPIIFILSIIINLELHHSPTGQWQDMFDLPALLVMYAAFIIVSVGQIYRGYKISK